MIPFTESAYTTACVYVHGVITKTFPKTLIVTVSLGDEISSDFPSSYFAELSEFLTMGVHHCIPRNDRAI